MEFRAGEILSGSLDDSGPKRDNAIDDIINRFLHDIACRR